MSDSNPYQSPAAPAPLSPSPSAHSEAPGNIIEALLGSRPWITFFGVMITLGGLLLILGGVAMLFMFLSLDILQMGSNRNTNMIPIFAIGGLFYFGTGALYIMGAVRLFLCSSQMGQALRNRHTSSVQAALKRQRQFFKLFGITILVVFGLYLLILLGAVGFGAFTALQ